MSECLLLWEVAPGDLETTLYAAEMMDFAVRELPEFSCSLDVVESDESEAEINAAFLRVLAASMTTVRDDKVSCGVYLVKERLEFPATIDRDEYVLDGSFLVTRTQTRLIGYAWSPVSRIQMPVDIAAQFILAGERWLRQHLETRTPEDCRLAERVKAAVYGAINEATALLGGGHPKILE